MKIIVSFSAVLLIILIAFLGVWWLELRPVLLVALPYLAVLCFLGGFIYRVIIWARSPVPFNIPTICGQQKSLPSIKYNSLESPTTTFGVIGRMALEILFFRSLFRNEKMELKNSGKLLYGGNKYLWLGALAFHWALIIILFRHLRFFIEPVPFIVKFAADIDGIFQIALPTLFVTDAIILIALTYLFIRRVIFPQLRYISIASDYFALFLLLGVATTGVLMRLFFKVDLIAIKDIALSMISFAPQFTEGIGIIFYIHLLLVSVLIAYFPFSKMMHAPGILLSPTRNLKNDSRMQRYSNPWNYPVKVHTYAEYEDEFRDNMKKVSIPIEKDK
jgi:nitrate reductase gamma subunit